MNQTHHSPVSPVESISITSTPPPPISTPAPVVPISSQVTTVREGSWLPFTFKWYFLLVPALTSLVFGVLIGVLVWYSQNHNGLGTDDGSSFILFGWRFTPTLFAVLYTQTTVILFEDAKRTEPFARLAKAPAEGASAYGTVLQTPRAWWSIFVDVLFKGKKIGKTSWCLILSALLNILALLALSPLSSALLTSEEVAIATTVGFTRTVPKDGVQLPLIANRETYFRTVAALMRNISTSAWTTDSAVTLPFWPSSQNLSIEVGLGVVPGAWKAETTTLQHDFVCKNMTLESAEMKSTRYSASYDVLGHGPYKGTQPMVTFLLTTDDGCRFELSMHPFADLAYNGGLTWSNGSSYNLVDAGVLYLNMIPFAANITSTSVYARLNSSVECRNRDLVLLSTPWTKALPQNHWNGRHDVPFNQTYERSQDFKMKALLCESHYTMTTGSIFTSASVLNRSMTANASISLPGNEAIPRSLVDIPSFETLALQRTWSDYFNGDEMIKDADKSLDGNLQPTGRGDVFSRIPAFSGLGTLLGATYSFNITRMLEDPQFANQAAKSKGRFFTECLREATTNPLFVRSEAIQGESTIIEERVLVLREIGIAMGTLCLVSFVLLALVYWFSRLSQRPLKLSTDPGSTVGLSMLLNSSSTRRPTFSSMHQAATTDLYTLLRSESFYTLNGTLHATGNGNAVPTLPPKARKHRWQPFVIRLRMLFALGFFLILVLAAILALDVLSTQSRLSQLAFVYEADVSKLRLSFTTFAPISIGPTVISILVGLWWDQLDSTLRVLQPYISMSQRPTSIAKGAGLTYRSKTWIGAAIKAARNKHFVLFTIALGSVLCQILTVSMSALFEQRSTNASYRIDLVPLLDVRQSPVITEVRAVGIDEPFQMGSLTALQQDPLRYTWEVLGGLYLDPPKNWLAGAAIQLSLNGSQLPWTQDGWSFVPLDLSHVPTQKTVNNQSLHSSNITVTTNGIRARLECQPVEEAGNTSTWLDHVGPDDFYKDGDFEKYQDYYRLPYAIFANTTSNTTVFEDTKAIECCTNGTSNISDTAAIGYWSPTDVVAFPFVDKQWPVPIVTKWIVGKPTIIGQPPSITGATDDSPSLFLFESAPALQAARCIPVIETADARVTLDKGTATVLSHELIGPVVSADSAWSDTFTLHDLSGTNKHYNVNYTGPLNYTTSYGVLFVDAMLNAADTNTAGIDTSPGPQNTMDKSFIMRDPGRGLNMDLMTYSMYTLAGRDPQALLNYTTLVRNADRTFATFFQHFVSNGISLTDGGLAYQKIGDRSIETLGRPLDINGSAVPAQQYSVPNNNRTAEAWVSHRIQVLHMNTVATYISVGILIWLIGTTTAMAILQRRYTSSMVRDVDLIADVLILVAGSENFMNLIRQRDVALKKDANTRTMLGWFKGADGEVRWGIEVVGGNNAVDWVDAPKHGWHVRPNTSSIAKILSWRRLRKRP